MSTIVSHHSRQRLVERVDGINSVKDAKRMAKQAWISGKTVNNFCSYPTFCNYLERKRGPSQNSSIRVYRGNVFIWRGKSKTLVTAFPVPPKYTEIVKEL